jgi:serine/threonine protein kinase
MSSVYLAEHVRLGRKVALKLLSPELADSEWFRDRFLRESHSQVVSERVVSYSFDQFAGLPPLDRIALAPGSE